MNIDRVRIAVLLGALGASTSAQVSVRATTFWLGAAASARSGSPSQSIAPGIDVTGGFSLAVVANDGTPPSSGAAAFTLRTTSAISEASVDVQAAAAAVSLGAGGGAAYVALDYASPIPIAVDVEMTVFSDLTSVCTSMSATVEIPGVIHYSSSIDCPWQLFPPYCSTTVPAVIDGFGLRIEISASCSAFGGAPLSRCGGRSWSTGTYARVRVTPRSAASAYGPSCGMTMSSEVDLLRAVETIRVHDQAAFPVAALMIGTQQVSQPLPWGCEVLTVPLAAVPLALDANGDAAFSFVPPPAGMFAVQAASSNGVSFHTSNGLQL